MKEAESSKVSTRVNCGGRVGVAEGGLEQENKDANVSAGTPGQGFLWLLLSERWK